MGGLKTETPPVLLAEEERSATALSADIRNYLEDRGVFMVLDVTAVPPAPRAKKEEETEKEKAELKAEEEAVEGTLKVVIEAKDEVSGKYVPLTAFAATKKASELGAGVTLAFTVATGAAETAAIANHEVQSLPLPRIWRAKVEHSKVGDWTYTLGYQALSG